MKFLTHFFQLVLAASTALVTGAALAQTHTEAKLQGHLIIMGGAVHPDTRDIWEQIVADAGGKGAAIAVIAAAAGDPQASAQRTIDTLTQYGAKPFFVPAAPRLKGTDYRAAANDTTLASQVAAAGGVFLNGGDQSRITDTLAGASGKGTLLLDAVWAVFHKGGVIAGTSAGAAVMSETMFHEPRGILELLSTPLQAGKDLSLGLGFIGPGVFVDQHLLARGRFARMLPAMRQANTPLGYGIDENTALRVHAASGQARVLGDSGVLLVDMRKALAGTQSVPFAAAGVRLSLLMRGDQATLRTGAITPSAFKLAGSVLLPHSATYRPEFSEPQFYPDVLGKNALPELLTNFLDNSQTQVTGLAFSPPPAGSTQTGDQPGFKFTFSKGPDTKAWLRIEKGRAHYTVADVELAVTPIRMARPLYEAW